jgi:hypothetical protein
MQQMHNAHSSANVAKSEPVPPRTFHGATDGRDGCDGEVGLALPPL